MREYIIQVLVEARVLPLPSAEFEPEAFLSQKQIEGVWLYIWDCLDDPDCGFDPTSRRRVAEYLRNRRAQLAGDPGIPTGGR